MQTINTKEAPPALGPYSQAVKFEGVIYISGQLGIDPKTGELCSSDIAEQAEQALQNIASIARAAGSGKLIKLTVYLCDISQFAIVNEIMARCLSEPYPARACVEVSALPKSAAIEIDAVAA